MPDYRQEFCDFAPTTYLDCAYQGPFPRTTVARIQRAIELKCRPERLEPPDYFDLPKRVRSQLAALVGADASEIALTNSATQGIGTIAAGLDLRAGDEVVIASSNFPANLFTWLHLRRRDVRVKVLQPTDGHIRVEEVEQALSPRTRVLALDWVSYNSGLRIDLCALGELVHHRGGIFVVDGSQGVGALELDLHALPVDAMAVAGYKWLLGPYGAGLVYISSRIQDRLDLQVVNWLSIEGAEEFDSLPRDEVPLPRAARIFDVPETANFLNLYALEASLEFIERAGVRTVSEHCTHLLERLAAELGRRGYTVLYPHEPERRSTILSFRAGSFEATEDLHKRLRARDVAVSLRHGLIRVSPYLYNNEMDIDRLLSVIRAC